MIRDDITAFATSRNSVAEGRSYKPAVAGSIPAGRTLPLFHAQLAPVLALE